MPLMVGNIVLLNSGSPPTTVKAITHTGQVLCQWINAGGVLHGTFYESPQPRDSARNRLGGLRWLSGELCKQAPALRGNDRVRVLRIIKSSPSASRDFATCSSPSVSRVALPAAANLSRSSRSVSVTTTIQRGELRRLSQTLDVPSPPPGFSLATSSSSCSQSPGM